MVAVHRFLRFEAALVAACALALAGCAEDSSGAPPASNSNGGGSGGDATGGETSSGGAVSSSGGAVSSSGGATSGGSDATGGGGGEVTAGGGGGTGGTPYVIEPGQQNQIELELKYLPRAKAEDVQPTIILENKILTSVMLNKLEIRYYVTLDGEAVNPWMLAASSAAIPDPVVCCFIGLADQMVLEVVAMDSPVTGADHYVKITFTTEDSIFLRLTDTVELKLSNYTNDPIVQTNDYSYTDVSELTVWDQITVYYLDDLIWGVEPQ